MSGDSRSIRVAVRVRPFNSRELEQNPRNIIKVLDQSTLIFDPDVDDDELFFFHGVKQTHRDITKRVKKKLTMEYDDVFDNTATNADIFEVCMRPLVQSVMNGYNCSVFVYGATGAGKTHTMLGNEQCPGITFLTMQELFAQIDALSDTRKFDIGISYLEVYNELVMNLLTKSGPLKLREDSNGVVVSGLVLKQIHNAGELLELLAIGNRNRTQHPTDANAESSRSHAIFQVHIRMCDKKTGQKRSVKLSMIDLAGSERAASTKGLGIRFKEGANINKSLLALGNCINKLADGLKHIPYRDSNLTRILKDSLGGNCQTVMIANVSPSSLTYDDTYNTLKYASRAKKIRTTVRQNIVPSNVPKEFLLKKVNEQAEENERLKAKLTELEAELQKRKSSTSNGNIVCTTAKFDETLLNTWHSRIDSIYNSIRQAQQHFYLLQSKKKLLNQKSKVKEQAEAIARILTLDGNHLSEDIAKMDASIDRYAKQIATQQSEMKRWLDRYRQAMRQLNSVRDEVKQSEMATLLQSYLVGKESEIQAAKAALKAQHMAQCITTYGEQNKQWQAIMQLASEIVQQNYLLLRGIDRLDNVTLEKMRKLVKLNQRQRGVTFFDDDNQQGDLLNTSGSDNSIEDIANLSECSEDAVDLATLEGAANGTSYKRTIQRQGESESETEPQEPEEGTTSKGGRQQEEQVNVFKKPKHVNRALVFKPITVPSTRTTVMRKTPTKAKALVQQQQRIKVPKLLVTEAPGGILRKGGRLLKKQLPSVGDRAGDGSDTSEELLPIGGGGDGCDNPNSTFCIDTASGKETDSVFSNVLVESNVDAEILDKVLRRASMKGKVTLSVAKENRKKSPKRIGKSPRPLKTVARTNSSATAVINRYRMMKGKDTAGIKSLAAASTSSSSAATTATAHALPVGPKVGPVARLGGANGNNNNLENDNDRNRHIRLMGIKK
ncbi:kinesin-like protein KIF18A [Anopheles aquasalis]|uniref:kinesin-like protein KIF18A n=1 Tax=Anopheles aquasalis TaxID=42839 RepID=UPI00215A49DC|nr:kinesin-like protein KIF18A [Anopheles aquasalis]